MMSMVPNPKVVNQAQTEDLIKWAAELNQRPYKEWKANYSTWELGLKTLYGPPIPKPEESKWDSEWGVIPILGMLHLTGARGITNEERGILRERFHHFLLN